MLRLSDEDTSEEHLFIASKPFSSSKTKLATASHPTTELLVNLIVNHEYRAKNSIILEAYISDPFIKIDDSNTITWRTMGECTTKSLGYACDIFTPRNKCNLLENFM
jgi:hypothetical protein